jgi:hypothetical protein
MLVRDQLFDILTFPTGNRSDLVAQLSRVGMAGPFGGPLEQIDQSGVRPGQIVAKVSIGLQALPALQGNGIEL